MSKYETIAVVGMSMAGLRGMEALRREGFEGRVLAIGEEPHAPYDRPPLSKQFLKGEWEPEKIQLRHELKDDAGIEWILGHRVESLDPKAKKLSLDDGRVLDYDGLMIATGARAKTFRGMPDLEGIHVLRTREDSEAMRDAMKKGPRVAVIGAGFIGMEVAASARELGLEVTVVEFLETPLMRGLGPVLGRHVQKIFEGHGVDIRCGVGVEGFEGTTRVEGLKLSDGSVLPADLVVVGIGAAPVTEWLEGSGLPIEDGVVCDETCAVEGFDDIVAAGDVARWRNAKTGETQRAEHWTNAVEQSGHAAARLIRGPEVGAFEPVPYVWTDQFELKLQMAGEIQPGDDMHICLGTLEEGRCIVLFGRDGLLKAAVSLKRPRQLHEFRDLISEGATWERALEHAGG